MSEIVKTEPRQTVLEEAQVIVSGVRRAAYGPPEDNFKRIADLWNVHLVNTGREGSITPKDVAAFMMLMKVARLAETPDHRDSIVDIIGYAACYAEIVLPAPVRGQEILDD